MINILGIPLRQSWNPPPSRFVNCPQCGQTYEPTYRSIFCPHAIGPARQLGAGVPAPLVRRQKKAVQPRAQRVLVEPYYFRQPAQGRIPAESQERWRAFSLWLSMENRSLVKVARELGYTAPTLINRWSQQDKWPLRLQAFEEERRQAERAAFRKRWEQRTKQTLCLLDSGLEILGKEYHERIRILKKAMAGDISTETLLKYTVELTKLTELLQGRATEHITHDTPEMARERKLRDAAAVVQSSIEGWKQHNQDVPAELAAEWEENFIAWGAREYEIDAVELRTAVLGSGVDESSTATN
jgi:hypothetical protein